MPTIVTRLGKGSPLTTAELDANLTNINAETVDNSSVFNLRPSLDIDLVGSKTVSPLASFSRGSTGTYYDGKTVAKAEENLLSTSKNFAPGGQINSPTLTTNTTDTTAPDGTQSATKMVITTGDPSACRYINGSLGFAGYTVSMYAKAGTVNFLGLSYRNSGASYAMFNLGAGVVEYSAGCTASMVNVGNGWWRCILANITQSSDYFIISPKDAAGTNAHPYGNNTVTTGATVYFWGPQYENRTTIGPYTETTGSPITKYIPQLLTAPANIPRFDHDPVSGELKGLLVEESRTNLLSYSNQIHQTWTTETANSTSFQANCSIAPDGTMTATKVVEGTTTGLHNVRYFSLSSGVTGYSTWSVHIKAGERRYLYIYDSYTGVGGYFDAVTGIVRNTFGGTMFSKNVGNGWWRISLTTTSQYPYTNFRITINRTDTFNSGTADSYTGDGYSGVYLWGAQLEAGSTPTSYIPTTTAAVTRSADQLSINKTSNWFNSVNGTLALAHDAVSGQPLLGDGSTTVLSSLGAGTVNIDYSNTQLAVVSQSGQTNTTSGIFNFDSDLYIGGNSASKINNHIKYLKFYPNNVINSTPDGSGLLLDTGFALLQEDGSVIFQE